MKNNLQIYNNDVFGKIRGMMIDGKPYFVGKDVASALGYKDTKNALKDHVKAKYKRRGQIATPSGKQMATLINEPGLYSLIMSSKLPAAEEFQDWIFEKVIPSIRKTGAYGVDKNYAKWLKARGNGKEIRKVETDVIKEFIEQVAKPQGYVEKFKGELYAQISIKANRAVGLKDKNDRDNGDIRQIGMLGVIEHGIRQILKSAAKATVKPFYKSTMDDIDNWIERVKKDTFFDSYLELKIPQLRLV